MGKQYIAFSGGKDSTALALAMRDAGEEAELVFNIVGGEFDNLLPHVKRIAEMTGYKLNVTLPARGGLLKRIEDQSMIPNGFARWCTRELKIEPTIEFLKGNPGSTLCIGIRADEELRQGIYGDYANYRYPLKDWGWDLEKVNSYLEEKGVCIPRRTNCPLCYGQRLSEWWLLWRENPEVYARGEELEQKIGHTFRNPSRDTWPVALKDLRQRFEAGDTPRGIKSLPLFGEYEVSNDVCRVCTI